MVETATVGTGEHRPFQALAERQVDRSGGAWGEWDRDDLAARAEDGQRPMPTFEAKPVDVSSYRL
jgi:hypothetical protein